MLYKLMLVTAILIGVIGQVFLKIGSLAISKPIAEPITGAVFGPFNFLQHLFNFNLLFGLFLYGVSTLFYIIALQKIPLSIAYPTISVGYIFILIISAVIFKEKITVYQVCGVLLIMLGVGLLWKK